MHLGAGEGVEVKRTPEAVVVVRCRGWGECPGGRCSAGKEEVQKDNTRRLRAGCCDDDED